MTNTTCSTDNCERKVYFRGQCHGHYVRVGRPKPRACSMEGCDKSARSQELCEMHYTRLRRHGDPEAIMNADRELSISERMERYGWTVTDSGCWEFNGPLRNGYGQISVPGNRSEIASRAAYMAWVGPIEDGLYVCHKCDNPPCINPAHLFLGTHDENVQDSVSKKRHQYGTRQWLAKLTDDEALAVREMYATGRYTQKQVGQVFGIGQTAVSAIVRRVNWKHVA